MRTRTSLLALVLTAGLAFAPGAARGQDYNPPDPVMPLPLYSNPYAGPYAFGEFVFWRMNKPLDHQVIATRGLLDFDGTITADLLGTRVFRSDGSSFILPGPRIPGNFLGSNRPALFADDAKDNNNYAPGFNIGAGYQFKNGVSIDGNWIHLMQTKTGAVATLVPPGLRPDLQLFETFLFSPVFSFPNDFAGAEDKLALGAPRAAYGIWNGASIMSISFTQRFEELDFTGRIPVYQGECGRFYGMIGPRFVWLWESFNWRTVSQNFEGQSRQDEVALYSNVVSNRMYGVHAGWGFDWQMGRTPIGTFALQVDAQALGLVDVVKERAKYERADKAISSHRSRTEYFGVPGADARANVVWYPIEGVEIRGGYDLQAFFNTIASPNPVSFNYGAPTPVYHHTNRYLQGIHIGLGLRF
ncbi:MAG TPA: Lpg1974 family pore-forming outer membrane protein [Gemmataceae bacterium]|nr:Lpg1974 family pore-forming outer membrane protein [Gemmataceae bacterium]